MGDVKLTKFKDGRHCLSFYLDGKRRRETFIKLQEAQRRKREVERLIGRGARVPVKKEVAANESARYAINRLVTGGIKKPLTAVVDDYIAAYEALGSGDSIVDACKAYAQDRNHPQKGRKSKAVKRKDIKEPATKANPLSFEETAVLPAGVEEEPLPYFLL